LYVGPALDLSTHRGAVGGLVVGVDHPFAIAIDPTDPATEYRVCRSALIPPGTLHHLADVRGRLGLLYFDARSRDLEHLRELVQDRSGEAVLNLPIEDELLDAIVDLADRRTDWASSRQRLEDLLDPVARRTLDPRVRLTLRRLHADPAARLSLAELAKEANLSESRLRHLFNQNLGISIRRYRTWIAMGAATRAIARGESLTSAALGTGFNSSAHFSASFRGMFGMEPSRFAGGRLTVHPSGS
jgi:AraC-like DNA-binding protein